MDHKKTGLGKAGRLLLEELESGYTLDGLEPAVTELCRAADRLQQIRDILTRDGLVQANGRKHVLVDAETKQAALFVSLWRLIGLADSDQPARPVGRPPSSEARKRA